MRSSRRRRAGPRTVESGQGLVEYALIFVLIVIIAIATLTFFGSTLTGFLSAIGTSI
jgi:Flp pilus assembly pilin Flp